MTLGHADPAVVLLYVYIMFAYICVRMCECGHICILLLVILNIMALALRVNSFTTPRPLDFFRIAMSLCGLRLGVRPEKPRMNAQGEVTL